MGHGLLPVFGGAEIQPSGNYKDPAQIREAYDALLKGGVTHIDTARLYGQSEEFLGLTDAHEKFTIDTKIQGGFVPGATNKEQVLADIKDSAEKVKAKPFDILYIHAPDASNPIENTLEGINTAYEQGYFKRFGLSNYTAEQVQEAYDVAKSKGWVLPTVYQGNYSPVARKLEKLLFPTLRKLGISFYAYSPLAGGFLTKTKQDIADGAGRFNDEAIGGMYKKMYGRPALLEALADWNDIAEKEGVPKAELAYRWVSFHSILKKELGDAVIFGASSVKQIEQTTAGLQRGPLSDEAVKSIENIWAKIEHEAPTDNFVFMQTGA